MPPPISRAPLRALSSSARPAAISPPTRLFSTTASRHEIIVPPESPRFIPLPDLPQSDETKKPLVKGRLPVPREIFTKRAHKAHKLSPTYVQHTAPKSQAEQAGLPPKSEKDAWKRMMADSRRQALGSGIGNLWRRKVARENRARTKADAHGARNLAAARAPERLDEVFTRGTITQATLNTAVVRDPNYAAQQRESAEKTAAIQRMKSQGRKDGIQRLYVEASNFILTEEELAARVDQVFSETYFKQVGIGRGNFTGAENVWEAYGKPVTVRAMFAELNGTSQQVLKHYGSQAKKTTERQKVVAGELTGGALSVN